jgi:hypothetical protein
MEKPPDRRHEFARVGAAIRLAELREEIRWIYKAFPAMRFQKRSARSPASDATSELSDATTRAPRRKKRKLTAAEKKTISDRMKKYWTSRKGKKS